MKFVGKFGQITLTDRALLVCIGAKKATRDSFLSFFLQSRASKKILRLASLTLLRPICHWFYLDTELLPLLELDCIEVSKSGSQIVMTRYVGKNLVTKIMHLDAGELPDALAFCKKIQNAIDTPVEAISYEQLNRLFRLEKTAELFRAWAWLLFLIVVVSGYYLAAPLREYFFGYDGSALVALFGVVASISAISFSFRFKWNSKVAHAHSIFRILRSLVDDCTEWLGDVESVIAGRGRLLWQPRSWNSSVGPEPRLYELVLVGAQDCDQIPTRNLRAEGVGGVRFVSTTSYKVALEHTYDSSGSLEKTSGSLSPSTQVSQYPWGKVLVKGAGGLELDIFVSDEREAKQLAALINQAASNLRENERRNSHWIAEFKGGQTSSLVTYTEVSVESISLQIDRLRSVLFIPPYLNEILNQFDSFASPATKT